MNAPLMRALVLCVALSACGPQPTASRASDQPAVAMTVTTQTVQTVSWSPEVQAQGVVAPWQEAVVGARVGGLPVTELPVAVGDRVRKGQVLARLDDRTVRAELAQAQAQLSQAQAQLTQAEANWRRAQGLQGTGAISEQDAQLMQTQAQSAQAQRQLAQARLQALEVRLQDCQVLAVDDGVVSARGITLGQVPVVGSELFRLIRQERLEWRAELTAPQLGLVQVGQAVHVTLPGGEAVTGKVRQLAPSLEGHTRMALAYVDLAGRSAARAGMYVSGVIQQTSRPAVVVPAEAVVLKEGRSVVFKLGAQDVVEQLEVVIGRRQAEQVEILEGLQVGDVVAVRGAGFLSDGDRVKRVSAELGQQP